MSNQNKDTNYYTDVDLTVINDETLSFSAKGLYALILCCIANGETPVTKKVLKKYSKEGDTALKTALNELVKAGYLKQEVR